MERPFWRSSYKRLIVDPGGIVCLDQALGGPIGLVGVQKVPLRTFGGDDRVRLAVCSGLRFDAPGGQPLIPPGFCPVTVFASPAKVHIRVPVTLVLVDRRAILTPYRG